MRIYSNCLEMVKEEERNLMELGIEVKPYSYQDKIVEGNPDFYTKELRGAVFTITNGQDDKDQLLEFFGISKLWAAQEFKERIDFLASHNPGYAWEYRREVWEEFLHNGKFEYSYSERMFPQLKKVLDELIRRPNTRQAIIDIHNGKQDVDNLGGQGRVPCSLNYGMYIRNKELELFYTMRSTDFYTHFGSDIWQALSLQQFAVNYYNKFMAEHEKIICGNFTFFSMSLHAFYKDLKSRSIF